MIQVNLNSLIKLFSTLPRNAEQFTLTVSEQVLTVACSTESCYCKDSLTLNAGDEEDLETVTISKPAFTKFLSGLKRAGVTEIAFELDSTTTALEITWKPNGRQSILLETGEVYNPASEVTTFATVQAEELTSAYPRCSVFTSKESDSPELAQMQLYRDKDGFSWVGAANGVSAVFLPLRSVTYTEEVATDQSISLPGEMFTALNKGKAEQVDLLKQLSKDGELVRAGVETSTSQALYNLSLKDDPKRYPWARNLLLSAFGEDRPCWEFSLSTEELHKLLVLVTALTNKQDYWFTVGEGKLTVQVEGFLEQRDCNLTGKFPTFKFNLDKKQVDQLIAFLTGLLKHEVSLRFNEDGVLRVQVEQDEAWFKAALEEVKVTE